MAAGIPLPPQHQKQCVYCQDTIPSYMPQDFCKKLECRTKAQQVKQKEVADYWKRLEDEHQKRIHALKADWESRSSVPPDGVVVLEIPHCNQTMEEIAAGRVEEFEEHLRSLFDTLDQLGGETKVTSPFKTPAPGAVAPLLGAMCAMCNGKCCNKGRPHHAFIQRSTITRVLADNPELSPEELVSLYLEHIPAQSMNDSCVYHTDTGCCLREDLRADICGEFFCLHIDEYIIAHKDAAPAHSLVVSAHECDIKKVRIIASDGAIETLT